MKERKQGSTTYPIAFLLVSSTDHIAPVTGATPAVLISKNGGAFGAPVGSVTEVGNGWYALAGDTADRDTLGTLLLHATATGADPADDRYVIVPWDPFDANLSLTNLDAPVSTRSIYAGADTPGTGTLLDRLTAGRAGNLDNLDAVMSAVEAAILAAIPVGPDNASIAAIKSKTDNLPVSPAAVGSPMTLTAAYDAAKAALPAGSYTAPDNAGIAAIKSKTDNIPVSPAAVGSPMTLTSAYDAAKTAAQPGAQMDLVVAPNATAIAAVQSGLAKTSQLPAAPDNAGIAAIKSQTDKLNFTGTDIKATLDGETVALAAAQPNYSPAKTGDAMSLTAGAQLAIAAVMPPAPDNSSIAAIKTQTDKIPDQPATSVSQAEILAAITASAETLMSTPNLVEAGWALRDALRIMLSVLAGKVQGAGTGTIHFRDQADAKDRIVAVTDAAGNRTSLTFDRS